MAFLTQVVVWFCLSWLAVCHENLSVPFVQNESAYPSRDLQGDDDDWDDDDGPFTECPMQVLSDAWSVASSYYQQHYEIIGSVEETIERWGGPVLALVGATYVPLPQTELAFALIGAGVSQLHEGLKPTSTPFLPKAGDVDFPVQQVFDCDNQQMDAAFNFAGLSENEKFFFSLKLVDLTSYATPYLNYCGPLPGASYHQSRYVAPSDKSGLERMCATSMNPDNLHLCLGDNNVMMNYLGEASRGYEQAAYRLNLLADSFMDGHVPKYGPVQNNDRTLLQLLESPFLWRFGQARIAAFVDYANLVTACYTERPANTEWGAENGAIGWSSLDETRSSLLSLTYLFDIDADTYKENAVRAALRIYKENYIRVVQHRLCRTNKKRHPKYYVALRDINPSRPIINPPIDLSQEDPRNIYTGIPYTVARQCFESSSKCNNRAKNYPMYANSNKWDWDGGHSGNFAVGCYASGNRNSNKILDVDIKDHWQPEHSEASISSLNRLDGPSHGGQGIGYGVDRYLDMFIKPHFEQKYDSLFAEIKEEMETIRAHVTTPMQTILDENRAAHDAYLAGQRGNANLRGQHKASPGSDERLALFTRLNTTVTHDLSRLR